MNVINLAWIAMIVNTVDVLICIAIAVILVKRRERGEEIAGDLAEKKQINITEGQINLLQEELTAVKTGYSAIKKENLEFKKKLGDSETELKNAVSKYSALEKDFKKKTEELRGATAKAAQSGDVNGQIEKLKRKEADLNNELSKQKKLIDNSRVELDKSIKENLESKDKLSKKEAEFKDISAKYSALTKDSKKDEEREKHIHLLQDEIKAAKDTCAVAQGELKALHKENLDFKNSLVHKEEELKEFQRVSEELKAFKTKSVKLSDFNAEVERLKKEIALHSNNVESLKKKDNDNIKQISSLQEELKAAQDSYSVARSELQEVSKKALDLSKEINKQKGLLDANKADLEQLRQENPDLREKLTNKAKELENTLSNYSALEKDFERLSEEFEALKTENAELCALQEKVEQEKEEKPLKITEEKADVLPVNLELASRQKYTKILEIMAEQNLISKDAFAATFAYYEKSGGNFVKYLIDFCHIDELKLAQTICHQFGVPYLPLSSYDISADIIQLVPRDVVEKYWLMPLQKSGSSLTVAMADPFDIRAINILEKITGYKVQAFVGVFSDIIQALENYYKIARESGYKGQEAMPLFITTEVYKGIDRRQGPRFDIKLDVSFPYQGSYKKAVTKDVSQGGVLFESDVSLDIGSILPLQVDLPKEVTLWPILAVIQVLRVQSAQDGRFYVAVKIVKIAKEEIDMVLKYALEHKGK